MRERSEMRAARGTPFASALPGRVGFPAAALVWLLVTVAVAAGQESRPAPDRRSPGGRITALRRLELERVVDPRPWREILQPPLEEAVVRAALVGMARVGDPALKPLLVSLLEGRAPGGDPRTRRAEAVAVGLFGDPDLLPLIAGRVEAASFAFAAGEVGRLPSEPSARASCRAALLSLDHGRKETGAEWIREAGVARLTYGIRLKETFFLPLALRALKRGPPGERRAAAFYLARHPERPPPEAAELLSRHLQDEDPECAALCARALARMEEGRERAAARITAAFLSGGARVVQVERLRALALLPAAPARPAVLAALKSEDPHLRRTALETLTALAGGLEAVDRRGLLALAVAMVEVDPVEDVRRVAVGAVAALDPKGFEGSLARYRLAGPEVLRIAAAGALSRLRWTRELVSRPTFSFVDDPDRRVRAAFLEAARMRAGRLEETEDLRHLWGLLSPANRWNDGERAGAAPLAVGPPATRDPVELSLLADLAGALIERDGRKGGRREAPDLGAFLRACSERLPWHEVECWQSVLRLAARAGGAEGRRLLETAAGCEEIYLRRLALRFLGSGEGPVTLKGFRKAIPLAKGPSFPAGTRARIRTFKGDIEVRFFEEAAPLTVRNFLALAARGFYDGILFHRVVPAFVAQAGCPRGDGWGGPGYTIPCELSDLTYRRGSLGMALAGRDTGGSQWFLCHRPTPHLDGRYTLFGEVAQGMEVLDRLEQGDVILSVEVRPPKQDRPPR